MNIIRKTYGELSNNVFIIYLKEGGEAYIIDPSARPDELVEEIKKHHLKLKGIILTHFHYDHVGACDSLCHMINAPVMLHKGDIKFIKNCHVDQLLNDGDILYLDGIPLEIIHTPGHSKGSICIVDKTYKHAFTGDTLFSTDTGYVTFQGGSGNDMMNSIKKLDQILNDDYFILPGHEDCVHMSYVRQHNKEFQNYLKNIIPN